MRSLARLCAYCVLFVAVVGCGKTEPRKNPFDTPEDAPKPAPKVSAPPKIEGPPPITIDEHGPKIGWDTVLIEKRDGRERLRKSIEEVKDKYENQPVELTADRKARTEWVAIVVDELARINAGTITIKTETTRPGFAQKLEFVPQARAGKVPPCTLVMMIREDRSPAIWRRAGEARASGAGKGLAGPDLTRAADIIERRYKSCQDTSTYFVSAANGIEWGLTYDLAVNAQHVEKTKLTRAVLLSEAPVAGRALSL